MHDLGSFVKKQSSYICGFISVLSVLFRWSVDHPHCTLLLYYPLLLLLFNIILLGSLGFHINFIFKYILLIMLLQLSHSFFSLFSPSTQYPHFLQHSPHLSSCPWITHISSLASPLPMLFLTSSVYFVPAIYTSYSLYLFPHLPLPCPADNPACDLHFCDSVPVLVVCLVWFCF